METRKAIRDGAKEIDMVINVGRLKGGDDDYVLKDILAVTDACRDGSAVSKVIIETALLTDEEKVRACELARRARANFVKTSTGFASRRRHRRGRGADGLGGARGRHGGQGLRRHQVLRRRPADDRGRRHPHRAPAPASPSSRKPRSTVTA